MRKSRAIDRKATINAVGRMATVRFYDENWQPVHDTVRWYKNSKEKVTTRTTENGEEETVLPIWRLEDFLSINRIRLTFSSITGQQAEASDMPIRFLNKEPVVWYEYSIGKDTYRIFDFSQEELTEWDKAGRPELTKCYTNQAKLTTHTNYVLPLFAETGYVFRDIKKK